MIELNETKEDRTKYSVPVVRIVSLNTNRTLLVGSNNDNESTYEEDLF